MGITFGDVFDSAEGQAGATAHGHDCQRHEHSVIVMPINADATFYPLWPPSHDDGVPLGHYVTASAAQFGTQIVDAITLFIVQALDVVKTALTLRETGGRYQDRYTVDDWITIYLDSM